MGSASYEESIWFADTVSGYDGFFLFFLLEGLIRYSYAVSVMCKLVLKLVSHVLVCTQVSGLCIPKFLVVLF